MRDNTFNQIVQEFDLSTAIKVVQFLVILKTTKPKAGDFGNDQFSKRCKRKFSNKIAFATDDVDKLFNIMMASVDFELKEDMDGLGGCKKSNTITELISK